MLEVVLDEDTSYISCIEIPGKVEGTGHSAIEALGGISALSGVLGGKINSVNLSGCTAKMMNSNVFLRCCPNDRFSLMFASVVQSKSDLLLRYRRNKLTKRLISIQLMGLVVEKRTFDFMSDFYYIAPMGSRDNLLNLDNKMNQKCTNSLFILPPTFTRVVYPYHYVFDDISIGSLNDEVLHTRKRKKSLSPNHFHTPSCPDAITSESCLQRGTDLSDNKVYQDSHASALLSYNILSDINDQCSMENSFDISQESDKNLNTTLVKNNQMRGQRTAHSSLKRLFPDLEKIEGREGTLSLTCRYASPDVPLSPLPGSLKVPVDPSHLHLLQKLFEERPIWIRGLLDLQMPSSITSWKKKSLLGRCCYLFLDGPWRGAYCALGYDPRQDPESRKYQTIDFRDIHFRSLVWRLNTLVVHSQGSREYSNAQNPLLHRRTRHGLDEDHTDTLNDLTFRAPPKRPSQLYQLCDIADPCVREVLATTTPLRTCCKSSGWLPSEVLNKIRDFMTLSSKRMRQLIKDRKDEVSTLLSKNSIV